MENYPENIGIFNLRLALSKKRDKNAETRPIKPIQRSHARNSVSERRLLTSRQEFAVKFQARPIKDSRLQVKSIPRMLREDRTMLVIASIWLTMAAEGRIIAI